jgi:hypothetical protein
MVTAPLIVLSSIAFHVMPNGPPNGPAPPWDTMPPLMVVKWIWEIGGIRRVHPAGDGPGVHRVLFAPQYERGA